MSYTSEKKAATIIPFDQSDIPESELAGLRHDEMLLIFSRRFKEAGEPWDKLVGWLDDHYIGFQGHDPQRRVLSLDWFGMGALMRECRWWIEDRRLEEHPPGADGEFE